MGLVDAGWITAQQCLYFGDEVLIMRKIVSCLAYTAAAPECRIKDPEGLALPRRRRAQRPCRSPSSGRQQHPHHDGPSADHHPGGPEHQNQPRLSAAGSPVYERPVGPQSIRR